MKYNVITLDTNVFDRQQYNLEDGILSQLQQFTERGVRLVISEIVLNEMKDHLNNNINVAKYKFASSIKQLKRHVRNAIELEILPSSFESTLHSQLVYQSVENNTDKRLKEFLEKFDIEIVPMDGIDTKQIANMYFQASPPFEKDGNKKCEFPDAIALLSLEKWADENKLKLLAISNDGGWKNYAKTSQRISVEKDLAAALENIQRNVPQVKSTIIRLLNRLEAGKYESQKKKIDNYISSKVVEMIINFSSDPANRFTEEIKLFEYESFECKKGNGEYKFYVVRAEENKIIVKISIIVSASILYEMRAYDDPTFGDEDRQIISTMSLNDFVRFDASILLGFSGDLREDNQGISIEALEFNSEPLYFDLSSSSSFKTEFIK